MLKDMELELWAAEAFNGRKDLNSNGVIRLYWTSKIGFGTYDLIINEGDKQTLGENGENGINSHDNLVINGYSEHMDKNEEKKLIKELLKQFIEKIQIVD